MRQQRAARGLVLHLRLPPRAGFPGITRAKGWVRSHNLLEACGSEQRFRSKRKCLSEYNKLESCRSRPIKSKVPRNSGEVLWNPNAGTGKGTLGGSDAPRPSAATSGQRANGSMNPSKPGIRRKLGIHPSGIRMGRTDPDRTRKKTTEIGVGRHEVNPQCYPTTPFSRPRLT